MDFPVLIIGELKGTEISGAGVIVGVNLCNRKRPVVNEHSYFLHWKPYNGVIYPIGYAVIRIFLVVKIFLRFVKAEFYRLSLNINPLEIKNISTD